MNYLNKKDDIKTSKYLFTILWKKTQTFTNMIVFAENKEAALYDFEEEYAEIGHTIIGIYTIS